MGFDAAFTETMRREGGYVLHKVEGDTGGLTYAGIARNKNPQWAGWPYIDRKETPPTRLVRDFYRANYWDKISGDALRADIAASMFDFAVNAGVKTACRLAQITAGVEPDGEIGPVSVQALNRMTPNAFQFGFFAAKMKRYEEIVSRNRSQGKFLLGWLRRSLDALA